MRIVLASASPRRKDLLTELGVPFEVWPSQAPEGAAGGSVPKDAGRLALDLARRKAADVATRVRASGASTEPAEAVFVVAADTLVVLPDRVLGKPASEREAREMLRRLSGREHRVVTGLVVVEAASGRAVEAVEQTRVFFRPLDDKAIDAYVATGEPADKAGAYAVQGVGSLLVERIDGDYLNVVGLPLGRLAKLFDAFGVDLLARAAGGAAVALSAGGRADRAGEAGGGGIRRDSTDQAQ